MQKPVEPSGLRPSQGHADSQDEIDLLGVARTLWRGKLWIALCMSAALALGWYNGFVAATPLYTATAQLALQVSSPPLLDLESVVSGFSGDEASINTEMAVVRSGDLLGRLIDELSLDQDPEFNSHLADPEAQPSLLSGLGSAIRGFVGREQADAPPSAAQVREDVLEAVHEAVSTTSSRGTYVFTISATTTNPEKSTLIANTLAVLYRDDQIELKTVATQRAAAWLSDRVGELRTELDRKENEIAELRAGNALVSPESLAALNEQAIELRAQLQSAQGQLTRTEERVIALEAADASGDMEAKVIAAEDSQLGAAAEAVAASEPGAQSRFDQRYSQVLRQTVAERERWDEQVADLQRLIDDLSVQFEGQSSDLVALQQLEQEAGATQVLYETFLARLRETTIQDGIHEADSRILTEAGMGEQVSPRKARILALALLLGLMLGAGLVLLREFLQNTFRTAEDLEGRTGRAVLGQIPRIPARARPDVIQYLLNKPASAAAEAVRNLRTSLLLSDLDRPPQVIMATSSVPNEGKTTSAIALALNLAGLNKKVLLVEGDIRRRTFNAYFPDGTGKGGLLSVISGKQSLEAAVHRPAQLGIDVLMGERSNVNAADVFSSESFRQFLEHARSVYDYLIIDTPPVLVVPDARVIVQHVDAALYIVKWDATSTSQVEEGLRQFRSVNAPIAGLVLSQVDPKGMKRYGYGGRYGAYSRYARGYYES